MIWVPVIGASATVSDVVTRGSPSLQFSLNDIPLNSAEFPRTGFHLDPSLRSSLDQRHAALCGDIDASLGLIATVRVNAC